MDIFHKNKERGFTLIEALVTFAIIGILVSIGVMQFRVPLSQRELNRAATELVSDIRWMQQLSANDEDFIEEAKKHRFQLELWDSTVKTATDKTSNGYQVLELKTNPEVRTVIKTIKFSDDKVNAQIVTPVGTTATITYYAFDLDRKKTDGTWENRSYQIMLTHTVTQAVMYVNVDSITGRVWTNNNGNKPL